ncbi:MAG: DUF4175 family protein [Bacteroidota bacterium]
MAMLNNNYQQLLHKLDQFTRKYYLNQLLRGALYSTGLILLLFLGMNLLEHYFFFGTGGRKLLFFSFLGASGIALTFWVLMPLLHYFRLGKLISHEQAAEIIGDHFGGVKDKLLNVLQLKRQAEQSPQTDLLLAGINQKTEDIKLVPFRNAINLNQNRKYLRYALPPLLLLLVILFAAPTIITESTNRLINNGREFERAAPFSFQLNEEQLEVVQFEDYLLEVTVSPKENGGMLPDEVYIDIDNYQYRLQKEAPDKFSYRFSNVQKTTDFNIFASSLRDRVSSPEFTLDVLKKPNILGFETQLRYPRYTQRKNETLQNIGDLVVPQGTQISWLFNSLNTDDLDLRFSLAEDVSAANRSDETSFSYKKKALRDETYRIYVSNKNLPKADSVSYSITVVPDLNPNIDVDKFVDSTDSKLLFFIGEASDDYGLLSLSFNYRIQRNGVPGELQTVKMKKPEARQISYNYTWDLREIELQPGDEIVYYFEVYDNDGVNGSKAARTNLMNFQMPTVEELQEKEEQNNDDIKEDLKESLKESRKLQREMKELREKLLQEREVNWQTKEELEKMMERQKELEKAIEEAKKKFEENLKNQEELSEQPQEEILEKQEKIQEMFEDLMSDEMKKLMDQIQELMQELEKDNALEMMEQMEMNDEELELELDRMLELFKQLEMESEIQKQVDRLEELAEEQEALSEDTKTGEESQEELEKRQEEINEAFEEIQEKQEELEKKNQELERPKDMGDQDEKMEDIEQNLQQSQEQLNQQENKKASKSQKKASEKMKEMAQSMQSQMQSGQMEQMEEDMASLRQLLENLVTISFDQEGLMDELARSSINTPRYVELVQQQFKIKDDFQIVEDSLQALAKRVFQIESFVTEKVGEIEENLGESLEQLEERKKPQAADNQQRTMKNVNDLALMLNEVMEQMQQQMSSMMSGNQMCNKPGGQGSKPGKVPMDKITKSQGELNQQMEQMKKAMEKGKQGSSKEFAKMAAKQAAMRKALREMQKEKQQQGQGGEGGQQLQEIIDQMNKVETDLVNKRLTNEMLKRQQEILTRLLEAEKADRQREYDNKRKAERASQQERKMPPSLEEYIKKREAEIELYKTVSPALKPYYKFLVEEYFKSLKKN